MMTMPNMTWHPVSKMQVDAENYCPFQTVFIMPANDMSYWELKVAVNAPLQELNKRSWFP